LGGAAGPSGQWEELNKPFSSPSSTLLIFHQRRSPDCEGKVAGLELYELTFELWLLA